MKNNKITVEADQISKIYIKADQATKREIEKIFDMENIFNPKHRVLSFEDACSEQGVDPSAKPLVDSLPPRFQRSVLNYYKLLVITEALNDVDDGKDNEVRHYVENNPYYQEKWCIKAADDGKDGEVRLYVDNELTCPCTSHVRTYSISPFEAQLCFNDRETAKYALKAFKPLYMELLTNQEPEE